MVWEDVTVTAKKLRKELKEAYPNTKFSVRSEKYSMGTSINVSWTDGAAQDKVEEILKKYEDLRMDESTGEILSGGNRFVFANRKISKGVRDRINEEVRSRYSLDESDIEYRSKCWQIERSTDYY